MNVHFRRSQIQLYKARQSQISTCKHIQEPYLDVKYHLYSVLSSQVMRSYRLIRPSIHIHPLYHHHSFLCFSSCTYSTPRRNKSSYVAYVHIPFFFLFKRLFSPNPSKDFLNVPSGGPLPAAPFVAALLVPFSFSLSFPLPLLLLL